METEKLVFAPFTRVSTEKQKEQGQSLETQRKQLTTSIQRLGGRTYDWYGGQEHATPDHERRELDRLMKDAEAKRFDAVMVADISRWSRDNGKSKEYLRIFKDKGIKFYVLSREVDLFDPSQFFMLGMNVEVAEFFADQQSYKSIINRIERAEKDYPSSSGRAPYGRIFNKKTGEWTVDEEKKRKIEEAARLYLEEDVSLTVLGERFGINHAYLWQVLTQRCGDTWEQRFQAKRFGIEATVTTKVPRLLPEETIQRLRAKCEARRVWAKGSPRKNQYLLCHLVYDEETGYTLSGATNALGQQHYRPFKKVLQRYMINAEVLETAVLEALFEALSDNKILKRAVFDGSPLNEVADALNKSKGVCEAELKLVERKLSNTARAISEFTGEDLPSFLQEIKKNTRLLEKRYSDLKFEVGRVDGQLKDMPTHEEIENKREMMRRQLAQRMSESYFSSGHTFNGLPFDDKRRLVTLIFGGKDQEGKRYGIYVRPLGGDPRRYKFVAYGRLGNIDGWIESRTGKFCSDGDNVWGSGHGIMSDITKVVKDADPQFFQEYRRDNVACEKFKAHMGCSDGDDSISDETQNPGIEQ